jgi:excinuclease ABC subunit C
MPKRIEVYDNSHISGEYAVGVFITAGAEGFIKNGYRKFNIRFDEIKNRDDTAMLQEVLRRRFKENYKDAFPDLIIIDGGLGQLSAAQKVFDELKINPRCVCMSKGEDRNAGEEFFHQIKFPTPLPPLPKEEGKTCFASDACDAMSGSSKVAGKVHSFTLPKTHKIMYYLQQLRDEAHRFAITTHRNKRAKSVTKSSLDDIDGIGKNRKKALLNHFGSLDKIKSATVEDLMRLDGISKAIAEKIRDFFAN